MFPVTPPWPYSANELPTNGSALWTVWRFFVVAAIVTCIFHTFRPIFRKIYSRNSKNSVNGAIHPWRSVFLVLSLICLMFLLFVTDPRARVFLNTGLTFSSSLYIALNFVPRQKLPLSLISLLLGLLFTALTANDLSGVFWLRGWARSTNLSLLSSVLAAAAWLTFLYTLVSQRGGSLTRE
jgi:hypothetical protein